MPITPIRVSPATTSSRADRSAEMSSISRRMRRPRSTTKAPSSVSSKVARSIRMTPRSRSSLATWAETLDCTVYRARAAAEKDPWSAMATNEEIWRTSIGKKDSRYRRYRLEWSPIHVHTFTYRSLGGSPNRQRHDPKKRFPQPQGSRLRGPASPMRGLSRSRDKSASHPSASPQGPFGSHGLVTPLPFGM